MSQSTSSPEEGHDWQSLEVNIHSLIPGTQSTSRSGSRGRGQSSRGGSRSVPSNSQTSVPGLAVESRRPLTRSRLAMYRSLHMEGSEPGGSHVLLLGLVDLPRIRGTKRSRPVEDVLSDQTRPDEDKMLRELNQMQKDTREEEEEEEEEEENMKKKRDPSAVGAGPKDSSPDKGGATRDTKRPRLAYRGRASTASSSRAREGVQGNGSETARSRPGPAGLEGTQHTEPTPKR